ncbi:MAG: hypothetical protein WC748_06665 [Legionellales bacterium]|jgi:hypothetical protein
MPRNKKNKFSLPANLFFVENLQQAKPQLQRIIWVNGDHFRSLNTLKEKYQIFQNIHKKYGNNLTDEEKKVPVIFYFAVDHIQDILEKSKLKIDPTQIALKLADIWPEIMTRLENTLADPSILFGTDIFYDICLRAYLYHQDTKVFFEDKIQYSQQMLDLFNEINSLSIYLPRFYLESKSFMGFNNKIPVKKLTELGVVSEISANPNNNILFPTSDISSPQDGWANPFIPWRINNVAEGSAPDDFEQFQPILALMKNKNKNLLKMIGSLFFFQDKSYWQALERLLWCYANALIYNKDDQGYFDKVDDKKVDDKKVVLTTLVFFCFNESESIISKDFVELFYGKDSEKSLLTEVLDSFENTNIDIEPLVNCLSLMSQEERSDWIEGILFLHVIEKGNIEQIEESNKPLLANIRNHIFSNPILFSQAYRSIENKYRERFKACSIVEKSNFENFAQSIYDKIFGKLSENGYANDIVYLMDLSIRTNTKSWSETPTWLLLCTVEVVYSFYHYILELLSWSWNHRLQLCIAIASSVVFGIFDPLFILESIGLEDQLNNLYEYADEAFGYIGGFILIRFFASCIQNAVTLPLNHFADKFSKNDLMTELGINPTNPSAHDGAGFTQPKITQYIPTEGKAYDNIIQAIKNAQSIADLAQQYEMLNKHHVLSIPVLDAMRARVLILLYEKSDKNNNHQLCEMIKEFSPEQAEIVSVILNHQTKIQKFFSSTTSAYISFVKTRANTTDESKQNAAAALYAEASEKYAY